jgi:pyruvate/2-oxoglutarate dehydrogenase complex dihydrolipoamide dehydrogenase (E3) component
MAKFDAIVIGTGPAGEHCLGRLSDSGLKIAAVERELVAGECSYWACMPSKTLLRPGDVIAEAQRAPGAAEAISGDLDVPAALGWRDFMISDLDDTEHAAWVQEKGTLLRGAAKLAGPGKIEVDGEVHESERIVIATGSGPKFPPIDGLTELDGVWTNREATNVKEIPGRLLILGGGPVGCELAQAFARMGSSVVIVEGADHLLPKLPAAAGAAVGECLEAEGIELRLGNHASAAERHGDKFRLVFDGADNAEGDKLLVATGRKARIEDLGLETVGIEADGPIQVDETMLAEGTTWLYAVGDVNGRSLLTHMGKHQGRVAADRIGGRDVACTKADGPLAPRVIFTEPQVAAVGHTLASAREDGLNVRAVDHPIGSVAGGSFVGKGAPGLVRLVVDEDRRVLVGATFTGVDVAEFVHAATIAVVGEVPLDRLWASVPSFPTRSEVWLRLLEKYGL